LAKFERRTQTPAAPLRRKFTSRILLVSEFKVLARIKLVILIKYLSQMLY
jgi:hypothetical protein